MIASELVEEDRSTDEVVAVLGRLDVEAGVFADAKLRDRLVVADSTEERGEVQEVVRIELEKRAAECAPEDLLIPALDVEVLKQTVGASPSSLKLEALVETRSDDVLVLVEKAEEVPGSTAVFLELTGVADAEL